MQIPGPRTRRKTVQSPLWQVQCTEDGRYVPQQYGSCLHHVCVCVLNNLSNFISGAVKMPSAESICRIWLKCTVHVRQSVPRSTPSGEWDESWMQGIGEKVNLCGVNSEKLLLCTLDKIIWKSNSCGNSRHRDSCATIYQLVDSIIFASR